MCEQCTEATPPEHPADPSRRSFLVAGATLAAAPLLASAATAAKAPPVETGLAAAREAEVTVFTTSPGKIADAQRLGAKEAVLWSDAAAMKRLANRFDLLISTVPHSYPMQPFMDVLALDGTLVNVGALNQLEGGLCGMSMAFGRKSLAGSVIGGIAETQEVVDYCAARGIKADVELIRPEQIDQAFDRVVNKDVRYRFVIDMTRR